ncbi:MAG: hypothetical protein PUK20_09805 [Firmicutes bacterium]|nr:hypothetical protein [Bacillota bacterium]MDY4106522.1 hypothetical protein [Oscillospiraceae bacterium]
MVCGCQHGYEPYRRGNERPKIGDVFYVIPTHICPTTALYSEVLVAENHVITEHWTVDARR